MNPNNATLDEIVNNYYRQNRDEIIQVLAKDTGMSVQQIVEEYEGGIDYWFGWGSVMMFELGYNINIQMGDEHIGGDCGVRVSIV
jgi:hypothetical protein